MPTINYRGEDLELAVASYTSNAVCMAICLMSREYGPYCTVTTFLDDMIGNGTIMPKNCAFIDTNNLPDIEDFLVEQGLAEPYTRFGDPVIGYSGFCEYPLMKFNPNKLRKLDPEGYAAYEKGYEKAFKDTHDKLYGKSAFGRSDDGPEL